MLPASSRLTGSEGFARATRRGRRAGSSRLVVHLAVPSDPSEDGEARRVGFVVSRAVGNAVVRNRVKRRLRSLCREWVARLPSGSVLVVRALPPAAGASYDDLRHDLGRCLERVLAVPASGSRT